MEHQDYEALLLGRTTERRWMEYNWRDAALYALAVGAGAGDTQYTCEKDMKAIPTFGVIPYWGILNVFPRLPHPASAPVLAEELLHPEQSFVNLEHEFLYHRPIDPMKGTFLYRDEIVGVYDRGQGRGMALQSRVEVCDEGGNLLCTNLCTTLFPSLGGFGGKPQPKNPVAVPEREPDLVLKDRISAVQHLLYRLTGDTNPVHWDDGTAKSRGLKGAFVHDLCAFGFACRLGIQGLFPGQPERLIRMAAQMKSIVYPDTPVALFVWRAEEGKAYFRLMNESTGKPVLDRGVLEWKEA